ncbi:alpha/beta hydrolase [Segatella copri]|uniref:alpha/beta hydrolase n=1 Tax=Segatella copri TaxID=165179 RepID=UPI00222E6CE7|nr:esterase family protein [Segatella copri]MCW4135029.1 esterase family protein [Segatella copri]
MKKYIGSILSLFIAGLCFTACDNDALDGMQGVYADMQNYTSQEAIVQPTTKLKKGVKALNVDIKDVKGTTIQVSFGSTEWILPAASYTVAETVANKTCVVKVNGEAMKSGDIDVSLIGGKYYLNGLFANAAGQRVKLNYVGELAFVVGQDDPEASGYMMMIDEQPVYDWTTGQATMIPGVTKYSVSVTSPEGAITLYLDLINAPGKTATGIVGTYTVQGNAHDAWLCDNGWVNPAYNMAGGSYYVDASGVKQYITSGQIEVSTAMSSEGAALFNLVAKNLGTTTADGKTTSTTGSFSVKFASLMQATGTELRDQTIKSTVLGRTMKYSVYLPKGYDQSKEYPVLYMLHGANGSNNDWLNGGKINVNASTAASDGTAPEMIVICPDCGGDNFYCDNYNGNDIKYMTYFFTEFLPTVENLYAVKKDRASRAIGGLSMGGFGSLYYGLLHPEMFSYVYACSPATYIDGAPNLYDLLSKADVSKLPGITIEIGTEDFLFQSAGSFKQALDANKVPNEYITRAGTHDWPFWAACTPKIMKKLGEVWQ